MKEKIISKTILFIGIILFINVFNIFFGTENTLVGVSTVVLTLVLLSEDLTDDKLKNFIGLIIVSLGLGLASHVASNNIWIGFFINFGVLFAIGYFLSYKFTKNLIVAFGLQYLFMLYTPVYGVAWGKRIFSLIFGVICVMIAQFIVYAKKDKTKTSEEQEVYSRVDSESNKETDEKIFNLFGKEIKFQPVRIRYAFRVGLLTAITVFVSGYFGLKQGRWMTFTVFSLTELYAEYCKIKSRQRVEGTIIGILIVMVLFTFIKNPVIRTLIGLSGGYLDSYSTNYREKIICVTVSVVAAMSITQGSIKFSVERLMYVVIGAVISLIANKFIFSYSRDESKTNITATVK